MNNFETRWQEVLLARPASPWTSLFNPTTGQFVRVHLATTQIFFWQITDETWVGIGAVLPAGFIAVTEHRL